MLYIIEYLGVAMFVAGLIAHFALGLFYGVWRPYFKRVMLSEQNFSVVIRYMGVSVLVAGIGMTAAVLANSQPASWFSTIFTVALCAIVWPILQTGVFIYHMRRGGHVRRQEERNWWKQE